MTPPASPATPDASLGHELAPLPGIRLTWRLLGPALRALGATAGGRRVIGAGSETLGAWILRRGTLGIRPAAGPASAPEVARLWLRLVDRTGMAYEVRGVDEQAVEIEVSRCPIGGLADMAACRAAWAADRRIVKAAGGADLEILETIGQGAPRCLLRLTA